jgi:hypothetical protein
MFKSLQELRADRYYICGDWLFCTVLSHCHADNIMNQVQLETCMEGLSEAVRQSLFFPFLF